MAKKENKKTKKSSKKAIKKPKKTIKKKFDSKKKTIVKPAIKKTAPKKQKTIAKNEKTIENPVSFKKNVITPVNTVSKIKTNRSTSDIPETETPAIINKPTKITVKSGPKKPEPKGKYVIEFSVRSSVPVLFDFISTPSGLAEWFADNVNLQSGGFFTFFWDGIGQQAKLIGYRNDEMVRFEWVGKKDGSYFEFRIQTDELTGDVSLIITDFSDNSELETNKLVWGSQVDKLLHVIGSYSP